MSMFAIYHIYTLSTLSVCVWLCVCVTIAERSAILLVLVIKLTKETRWRAWRGRDREGEIGKGQIREGGYEWTFHCLSQTWETCRFTVPPAVALLNYISSGILWWIFSQTGIFAGFSLNTINFAVYYVPVLSVCFICMSVIQQTGRIKCSTVEKNKKIKKVWSLRKTPQNDGYVYIYN